MTDRVVDNLPSNMERIEIQFGSNYREISGDDKEMLRSKINTIRENNKKIEKIIIVIFSHQAGAPRASMISTHEKSTRAAKIIKSKIEIFTKDYLQDSDLDVRLYELDAVSDGGIFEILRTPFGRGVFDRHSAFVTNGSVDRIAHVIFVLGDRS